MAAHPLTMLANTCITSISILRSAAGLGTLLAPQLSGQVFGIPIEPEGNLVGRLFGVRDLALGILLWRARSNLSRTVSKGDAPLLAERRRDLSKVLWVGLLIDAVDVGSTMVAILSEGLGMRGALLGGAGAASFVAMAGLVLRRL